MFFTKYVLVVHDNKIWHFYSSLKSLQYQKFGVSISHIRTDVTEHRSARYEEHPTAWRLFIKNLSFKKPSIRTVVIRTLNTLYFSALKKLIPINSTLKSLLPGVRIRSIIRSQILGLFPILQISSNELILHLSVILLASSSKNSLNT